MGLPRVRSHERMDFKRCQKKWYWHWRKGLVPKAVSFGALDLGTWVHEAFAEWYGTGYRRNGDLEQQFMRVAEVAIEQGIRDQVSHVQLDKAGELAMLGAAMMRAYQLHYGNDPDVYVLGAEIPLEFEFPDQDGRPAAIHMLKPDLVYAHQGKRRRIRLMENKTAASIHTSHLTIDDQARPYGIMAERALKRAGVLGTDDVLEGITYNFLRKGLPDNRKQNAKGQYLNKNGSVSARQPPPLFERRLITLTRKAKAASLHRIRFETALITEIAADLRTGILLPDFLLKTPHHSCPRFCQYFAICEAEENGTDIRDMIGAMYRVEDPYRYEESTDELTSFEMG